ncbi:MAG: chromosome segregation protein SMC [Chitinivibrionales bacterium]|nr:chromosome segregation protein SMC [Chitinivibrionales bacterium]
MLLKKLSIFGFKSLADKTEIRFGEGITAVIGPNGCGKSNVMDAIRWVFGEQKPTALRGTNMQDVIFSGTQKRQPLNMAEVTLLIENNDNVLPVEYGEVAITRRVFRNEESEYRINKVPCRLRDIQNLFLDTGLGSSCYTTIENAMINAILSDKVEEKRMLFEEAAGIGKYKHRRKESLRQLERTRQDLLRINDTVQEAERQVRILASQLEKVKRYKRYFEDLKSLELGYENRRFTTLKEALASRLVRISELSANAETLHAKIAAAESTIQTIKLGAGETEQRLFSATEQVGRISEAINDSDKMISVSNERLKHVAATIERLNAESKSLENQIGESGALKMQCEKNLVEYRSKQEEYALQVEAAQGELAKFDRQMQEKRQHADQLTQQQIRLIQGLGEKRTMLNTFTTTLSGAFQQSERGEKEIQSLQTRFEEYQELAAGSRSQLTAINESHQNLLQSRETLLARIAREDAHYQEIVEREKRLEATIDSCKSKRSFLEGLDANLEGYESGVKALLQQKLPGMLGCIANLISVSDEKMAALIEHAVGGSLQTVVFTTEADVRSALEYLQREKVGAAMMVSLERLNAVAMPLPAGLPAEVHHLRTSIKTDPEHGIIADFLFNSIIVTETGQQAFDLSYVVGRDVMVVAQDAVICSGSGLVRAGQAKREQAGILQRKQQLEKLALDLPRYEKELAVTIHDKEICIITREEARFALVEIDERLNKESRLQQEEQTNIRHYENEITGLVGRLQSLRSDHAALQQKIEDLQQQIAAAEVDVAQKTAESEALTSLVDAMRREVEQFEAQRGEHLEHVKNVELTMMQLTNTIQRVNHDIETLAQSLKQNSAKKQKLLEEAHAAQAQTGELSGAIGMAGETLAAQRLKRTEAEGVRDGIRETYNGMLQQIDELTHAMRIDQNEYESQSNQAHALQIDQTRQEQEQRAIRERIWEAYEIDLESPADALPLLDAEDAAVTENIATLKERLKRVGQVNMAAIDDFETESKRLADMTAQRDDLQKACDDLDKAIKKLDREARVQFVQTFEQAQRNFTDMFTTLFEGGEARIALEENVDPLEAAITIDVRPAGKKMRGVQLLSSGERALTATALLFALYRVKPSAYCILDELDAPLDDANIDRYTRLLKRFSEQTQFIVITHNKHTMEVADLIYGVTQQEQGVSSIVSVRFEEAALQAA